MESVGGFLRTRLAFTVARYFPSSVRSIVHDGPYLPKDQEVVEDLRGTEVVLNKLFSKCATDAACSSGSRSCESISGRACGSAATPLDRDERLDASRVMQFSRNLLFSGSYLSLEHRVQNLLDLPGCGGSRRRRAQRRIDRADTARRAREGRQERDARAGSRPVSPGTASLHRLQRREAVRVAG